ncbi:MAG: hypothetical protein QFX40_02275 [Archaeoglobales archaeon]|nr:hypothetical protein [Archaeoglobales archaeon]
MYTALIHGLAVLEIFYLGRNKKEYVNIAISKELKEVAIVREHVLRNSKIPVIALA